MEFIPHPYQDRALWFMVGRPASALLMDMGLGKTVVTLTAFTIMNDLGLVDKVLIVAPLRVIHNVWMQEAAKWDHTQGLRFSVLHGKSKAAALRQDADIYLINYDGLPWLEEELPKLLREMPRGQRRLPWQMLVLDESTAIKDPSTNRFKILQRLVKPSKSGVEPFPYRVLLTATPAPQGIHNLWAQIYMLDYGQRLGKSATAFSNAFMDINRYSYITTPKPGATEAIQNAIADLCLRMRAEDYLTMPDRIDNKVMVDLNQTARGLYNDMEAEFFCEIEEFGIEAFNAASRVIKLRQLVQGAVYVDDALAQQVDREYRVVHKAKVEALKEIIEQTEGPVIVAFQFRFESEILSEALGTHDIIEGGVPEKEISRIIERWNQGKARILLVQPASVSYGLNLQSGGNTIIWYGLTWSGIQHDQLIGRLYRQGQQAKNVIVHYILAKDTIDEAVFASLQSKKRDQEQLLLAIEQYRKRRQNA